jgi:hypothetical protein
MAAAGVNWTVGQTYTESVQARLDAVSLCLELGADVKCHQFDGTDRAPRRRQSRLERHHRAAGQARCALDIKDKEGRTPLRWAEGVFLASVGAERKPNTIALLERLIAEQKQLPTSNSQLPK